MQLNSGQLARHGLTVETAFDACRNMAAGDRQRVALAAGVLLLSGFP